MSGNSARIVIIGGGIIGCSTAYHLGKMGYSDTQLFERAKLTSGTTFHAAGLVGQLRTSANITQLLGYSVDLYRRLAEETGLATGWKMNGGLRLACNADRWIEVKRQATTAHSFGLEMHLLSPREAQDLWPLMRIDDLVGAAYLPTDGQANPSDITQSLAKGARQAGVTLHEDTPVTRIVLEGGKVRGVETAKGFFACEKVVICAGQWTRDLAATVGVNVPLVSVEHQYMITDVIPGVTPGLPTLRDPDRLTYWKEEVGGLVWGGYEPNPKPWATSGIPEGFHFTTLPPDLDHYGQFMADAIYRVPALETAGVKQLLNGPESFTPDGNFILGEAPEQKGIFIGAGFNAFGIASGGGAGMALAEWAATGAPPFDLWPVDIRRFGPHHSSVDWVRARTLEAYAKHYTIAWPGEEMRSARPLRRSALYGSLKAAGAVFGEKLGWERPNWFARQEAPEDVYSYTRPGWWQAVAREHRAAREDVVLIDQSSFAKFRLDGPDAEAALSYLAAGRVERAPGTLTYSQLLNDKGGIEADVTIARLGPESYYIVTGTGFATRDFDWIAGNLRGDCRLTEITAAFAVLSLMGPRARAVLQALSKDDLSNPGFPFATARWITLARCPVLALRVTYVGELGWELHIPVDYAQTVYDALMAEGVTLAGYRAIETLRLEKGYRAWGAEIGPDHSPLQAGLGWAVKLGSPLAFKGRAALEAEAKAGLPKRLATFWVEDPGQTLLGRETIYRNGERIGWLASGGHGHTLDRPIGMGYIRAPGVDQAFLDGGQWELEIAAERHPAKVTFAPLYDPKGLRVRA
jgi:4-methylaminobutanoate oxidase (formaldehyde-forming)